MIISILNTPNSDFIHLQSIKIINFKQFQNTTISMRTTILITQCFHVIISLR